VVHEHPHRGGGGGCDAVWSCVCGAVLYTVEYLVGFVLLCVFVPVCGVSDLGGDMCGDYDCVVLLTGESVCERERESVCVCVCVFECVCVLCYLQVRERECVGE